MRIKKLWIPGAMAAAALLLLWAFVCGEGETDATYRFVAVERGTVESVVTSTGTLQATDTVEVGTHDKLNGTARPCRARAGSDA